MDQYKENFIASLSALRFQRYFDLCDGNNEKALALYNANSQIAQSLYIPIQALEIALRNAIHDVMERRVHSYWFDDTLFIKNPRQIEQISQVKIRILKEKKNETDPVHAPRIIAGLPFGFWNAMFNDLYEDLWRTHLNEIIVKDLKTGVSRKGISKHLNKVRHIRNRIAHHESIIIGDLSAIYDAISQILTYISPETKFWMKENQTFTEMFERHKELIENVKLENKRNMDE